jgi:hypothetical protein
MPLDQHAEIEFSEIEVSQKVSSELTPENCTHIKIFHRKPPLITFFGFLRQPKWFINKSQLVLREYSQPAFGKTGSNGHGCGKGSDLENRRIDKNGNKKRD